MVGVASAARRAHGRPHRQPLRRPLRGPLPRPEHLAGLDVLLVDLADVGARYYTFVWTASSRCAPPHRAGVQVLVLDRPNPIGGLAPRSRA